MKKVLFSFLCLLFGIWLVADDLFAPFSPKAEIVEIPELLGLSEQAIVLDDRFELQREYRYDEATPEGTVILQEPAAGSRRKRTSPAEPISVRIVISLGKESIPLPTAVGKDARVVAAELRALGLSVETESRIGARPEGEVLSMSPLAGTRVPKGTKILLTVSAGPSRESVTVPNLVGLSRAQALVRLWTAQLSLAAAEEVESPTEGGIVVAQDHQPGTVVPAGTAITLYVSREVPE
ncbi:MAG: PASTA domain-containing protein [Ruminococcaceae bacterium]|nr:PASTA domain-containing protein [Oscillospiraceae bacterium]